MDSWDFRTEPEGRRKSQKNESVGLKSYFKKNYSKGEVDYTDSFEGTMIRNYLDNLTFFKKLNYLYKLSMSRNIELLNF